VSRRPDWDRNVGRSPQLGDLVVFQGVVYTLNARGVVPGGFWLGRRDGPTICEVHLPHLCGLRWTGERWEPSECAE
jgi:hypothetical protein